MNVTQAIDAIYEVFGIPNNASAPEIMRRRIFNDLNSALQLIWVKGHRLLDYYTRRAVTATISANANSVVLDDSVEAVLGPVRRVSDGVGLRPIRTRGEYDSFASIYAGSLTALTGALLRPCCCPSPATYPAVHCSLQIKASRENLC